MHVQTPSPPEHRSSSPLSLVPEPVKKAIIAVACAAVLYQRNVFHEMIYRVNTYNDPLYISYALYVLFAAMWAYAALMWRLDGPHLYVMHEQYISFATLTFVAAGVMWIAGMWTALRLWTLPLYVVMMVLLANLNGLLPSMKAKRNEL